MVDDNLTISNGKITKRALDCNLDNPFRKERETDSTTELIGAPISKEGVTRYANVGVKKASTMVFGKNEDGIPAAGANYYDHDYKSYNTTSNVSRIINRPVFTVKAPDEKPGTTKGSTIIIYSHIGD